MKEIRAINARMRSEIANFDRVLTDEKKDKEHVPSDRDSEEQKESEK